MLPSLHTVPSGSFSLSHSPLVGLQVDGVLHTTLVHTTPRQRSTVGAAVGVSVGVSVVGVAVGLLDGATVGLRVVGDGVGASVHVSQYTEHSPGSLTPGVSQNASLESPAIDAAFQHSSDSGIPRQAWLSRAEVCIYIYECGGWKSN